MNRGKYYITTAIAYTSGKPHIGNSYEIVLADSIARFKRKDGYDVFFQTGTDEHGQKIELKAQEAGVTPKEYVDGVANTIREICDSLNTSYDKFIRTTDDYHEKQVQKIFKRLYDKGDIYKGAYEGLYCTPCESFWTESQLVDGKCPDCGREVKPAKEEAYFFKMSKYAERLIKHINDHPEFIQPVARKNEMMNNFLLPGLQDLCVSRTSFKWGIPVDFDNRHVVYVWLDALTNYITGIGYDAEGNSTEQYKKLWPADLHLIGKDIIRFHTIYWPIFLMALEEELPKQVFGHPWLLQGDGKMSKSKGNVIYAEDLISFFGVDAVRYFVLHERFNSDLANTMGNLVNRTVSMSNKYFGGVVADKKAAGDQADIDADLKQTAADAYKKVSAKMESLRVADAISEIFTLFKRCNKYIDETMPWALAKDEAQRDRLGTVLYNLLNGILVGASLLEPFMPETAQRIAEQIKAPLCGFEKLEQGSAEEIGSLYPSGNRVVETPEILFARLKTEEVMEKVDAMFAGRNAEAASGTDAGNSGAENAAGDTAKDGESKGAAAEAMDIEAKPEITYDDFAKCQFQVGEIIDCKEVPKSKKLLCSQVKVGSEIRQILSGIKQYYSPEEMVGKKVMVLVNLAPRKMAGLESQGMLLCAEDADGNLALMTPEKAMPAGAEIC